ncbi:MAG: transposase [Candidatus Desantisbacteria bacterium]
MPRIARTVALNYPHHVTQRGNNRQDVFLCDEDRRYYLELLKEYAAKHHCWVWAYCLMTNHVHLLLVPQEEGGLGKCLQGIALCYTQYFNLRYHRTGRLWESRYYSCIVDKESYLWEVSRYIEQNPVRAGLVKDVQEYDWSSGKSHILGEPNKILTGDSWLDEKQRRSYIKFVSSRNQEEEDVIRRTTKIGRPLGVSDFLDKMEALLARHLRPRKGGRPPKKKE